MQEIFPVLYPWIKTGHIVFMVFWLAGLFMLPRQCIYMLDTAPGSDEEAKWAERMGKLRRIILIPGLIVVWVLGFWLAVGLKAFSGAGWLHAKLILVLALTVYHGWLVAQTKRMARGERPLSEKALRMIGEVPGLLLLLIVLLVVLKPF